MLFNINLFAFNLFWLLMYLTLHMKIERQSHSTYLISTYSSTKSTVQPGWNLQLGVHFVLK